MPSTNWAGVAENSTDYSGDYYIPNLGVLMNDTGYIMNDTVATMNDQIPNPIFAPSTNYGNVAVNSTNWS